MCFSCQMSTFFWGVFTLEAKGVAVHGLTSRWRKVFMDLFSPPAPTPESLLCLPHAAPDERSSCTNFIPLHRGGTHVGGFTEGVKQSSHTGLLFLALGLLLSSQGLHVFRAHERKGVNKIVTARRHGCILCCGPPAHPSPAPPPPRPGRDGLLLR